MNGIGFHILYDAIDGNLNPLRAAIINLLPRTINVVGGARKAQAFAFADEMHIQYPAMRIIWRNWPDDGNHAKDKYKLVYHRTSSGELVVDDASGCQRWIDDNQAALAAGLTVLTDNESTRADLDVYAKWQALVMDLAGAKGWKVAVGRFATGNPQESQYQQLDSMFESLNRWNDLHCFSPNEYISKDAAHNGGNINRYMLAVNRAKQIGTWPFPISIGEFGILAMDASGRLDPEAGYHDGKVGLSGKQAARFSIDQIKTWYLQNDVDACVYCWGGDGSPKWDRCRIDNDPDFIQELVTASTHGELALMSIPVQTLPQSVAKPANAGAGRKVIAKMFRNIRSGPSTRYHDDGDVIVGDELMVFDTVPVSEKLADGSMVYWWWMESAMGNGWIQSTNWKWENTPVVVTPAPDPLPVPPPETLPPPQTIPSPVLKRWSFSFEMVGTEDQKRAMEQGGELLMAALAWIGQAAGTAIDFKGVEVPMQ